MAALLLTPANLYSIKSSLRTAFPEIKSSHLSEALAAALGYRTHAALLADIKASPDRYPPLARASNNSLARRLNDFGLTDYAIDLNNMVRKGIPEPIWSAFPRRDLSANTRWYRACQRRNIPFVYLHTGHKYWRLNWDCISTKKNYDEHIRGESGAAIMRTMFQRFQERGRVDSTKAFFDGSAFVGDVKRLAPETARDLADDFFEMLYSPVRAA